jgi:hypothetical protein
MKKTNGTVPHLKSVNGSQSPTNDADLTHLHCGLQQLALAAFKHSKDTNDADMLDFAATIAEVPSEMKDKLSGWAARLHEAAEALRFAVEVVEDVACMYRDMIDDDLAEDSPPAPRATTDGAGS